MAFGGNFGNNFGGQQVSITGDVVATTDNITTSKTFAIAINEVAVAVGDTISRIYKAFRNCITSIIVTDGVTIPFKQDYFGTDVSDTG